MTRHRFDPLSFVFGLVFVLIAVAGLTGPWMLRPVDLAWAGPAVLILLGVVVLASGGQRRDERPVAHAPDAHVPGGQSPREHDRAPGPSRPEDG